MLALMYKKDLAECSTLLRQTSHVLQHLHCKVGWCQLTDVSIVYHYRQPADVSHEKGYHCPNPEQRKACASMHR